MADRPKVSVAVARDVLFAAFYRCAACGERLPLELAHIIPWHKTKDNSSKNLVALCCNCHDRSHREHWGADTLRRFKLEPFALRENSPPQVSAEQQAMIDLIVACDPDSMTEQQRLRLVRVIAAFLDVSVGEVKIVSVTPTNSSRVRIQLPQAAAARMFAAFQRADPELASFFEEFPLMNVQPGDPDRNDKEEIINHIPENLARATSLPAHKLPLENLPRIYLI